MLTIKQAVGNVVASDTQETVRALDKTIANQTRMIASVIDAAQDSHLPLVATQAMLEELATGLNEIVSGRARLGAAVKEMAQIQSRSNLRETSFVCPNGSYLRASVQEPEYAKS
jgi:septation ring formation regulator EzrA